MDKEDEVSTGAYMSVFSTLKKALIKLLKISPTKSRFEE